EVLADEPKAAAGKLKFIVAGAEVEGGVAGDQARPPVRDRVVAVGTGDDQVGADRIADQSRDGVVAAAQGQGDAAVDLEVVDGDGIIGGGAGANEGQVAADLDARREIQRCARGVGAGDGEVAGDGHGPVDPHQPRAAGAGGDLDGQVHDEAGAAGRVVENA